MSLEKHPVYEVPGGLRCPQCDSDISHHSPLTGHKEDPQIHKGQIIVCGNCASILKVDDSSLRPMLPREFNALDPRSKAQLKIIVGGIVRTQNPIRKP